jgi:hypothetical protein
MTLLASMRDIRSACFRAVTLVLMSATTPVTAPIVEAAALAESVAGGGGPAGAPPRFRYRVEAARPGWLGGSTLRHRHRTSPTPDDHALDIALRSVREARPRGRNQVDVVARLEAWQRRSFAHQMRDGTSDRRLGNEETDLVEVVRSPVREDHARQSTRRRVVEHELDRQAKAVGPLDHEVGPMRTTLAARLDDLHIAGSPPGSLGETALTLSEHGRVRCALLKSRHQPCQREFLVAVDV